nr:retrotransposon protein, putative, Ty1-copia subclass [Tanacetum cinerariifolium]
MQEKIKLSKSQGASTPAELKRMQNVSYASAVGSIIPGYVFVLNYGAVDWKSAKQSIFATSSTEAEYIGAFDASKEDVKDNKEKEKIKSKTGQNQEQTRSVEKSGIKPDKVKAQSKPRKH